MPRILDVLISTLALLMLLPLLIPIVIILFMTGEHKVFYFQTRVGYKKKNFKIIKFATMLSNSANMRNWEYNIEERSKSITFWFFSA